jgi:hypothetical protein
MSTLDWPAHEWVPDKLAQSFWPILAIPKHFSFSCAAAGTAIKPIDITAKAVAAIIARWFI